MTPNHITAPIPGLRRLTTPRAAAWAGVLFAVLFGLSLVLMRLSIPADPFAEPNWLTEGSGRLRWAMTLMPLSGIAFLWFVGVVRDRLGQYEDRFLASVFLGSGLLFLAMAFASTAIAGGILVSASDAGQAYDPTLLRFARATMLQVSNVYALRMAAAFMISLATIWLRTGLMPRWLAGLTYALALVLLVVTTLSLWTTLVFPAWVLLVSVLFLVRSFTVQSEGPAPD
ncbi:MAG TPA: hypothetical protein VI357_16115 [Mycobacteriales bacterium]